MERKSIIDKTTDKDILVIDRNMEVFCCAISQMELIIYSQMDQFDDEIIALGSRMGSTNTRQMKIVWKGHCSAVD